MSIASRLVLLTSVVLLAALAGLAGPGETPVSSAPLQPTPTLPPEGPVPCNPKGSRFISPVVMEAGSEFGIETWFDFSCSRERRIVNFMLVVEDSTALRAEGIQPLRNLQTAMQNFVNEIDWRGESTGGLLLYVNAYTVRQPPLGGTETKTSLRNAIRSMRQSPIGAGGVLPAPAIRAATGLLPTEARVENETNVVIIVDSGGSPLYDGGEGTTMATACGAAQAADTLMVLVALEAAGGFRLHGSCADRGWYFRSSNEKGEDLVTIFELIADRLLSAKQVDIAEYDEYLRNYIEYQRGSSTPKEPVHIGNNEWVWQFTPPIAPGGEIVSFRAKVDESVGDSIFEPVLRSDILMNYNDGSRAFVRLPAQKICVFRKGGDPSYCDGAFTPTPGTPTVPPADTPTPTETVPVTPATETPTVDTPTDTPTPEPPPPTDTPEPPGPEIYLPVAAANAPIGQP